MCVCGSEEAAGEGRGGWWSSCLVVDAAAGSTGVSARRAGSKRRRPSPTCIRKLDLPVGQRRPLPGAAPTRDPRHRRLPARLSDHQQNVARSAKLADRPCSLPILAFARSTRLLLPASLTCPARSPSPSPRVCSRQHLGHSGSCRRRPQQASALARPRSPTACRLVVDPTTDEAFPTGPASGRNAGAPVGRLLGSSAGCAAVASACLRLTERVRRKRGGRQTALLPSSEHRWRPSYEGRTEGAWVFLLHLPHQQHLDRPNVVHPPPVRSGRQRRPPTRTTSSRRPIHPRPAKQPPAAALRPTWCSLPASRRPTRRRRATWLTRSGPSARPPPPLLNCSARPPLTTKGRPMRTSRELPSPISRLPDASSPRRSSPLARSLGLTPPYISLAQYVVPTLLLRSARPAPGVPPPAHRRPRQQQRRPVDPGDRLHGRACVARGQVRLGRRGWRAERRVLRESSRAPSLHALTFQS